MIASSLFTLFLAVTSLAGVNAGLVQRNGTSYLSPQPTSAGKPTSSASVVPSVSPTTTTTKPTTTTTPAPSGTANCNGVQLWQSAFAYTAGNKVIFNDNLYTALQWTYDNAPPSHPDQWAANGVCSQPINNKVSCTGIAAWQSNVAYTTGNQVTYNGHLWAAVQWTEASAPGGTSGTWQDLGACM